MATGFLKIRNNGEFQVCSGELQASNGAILEINENWISEKGGHSKVPTPSKITPKVQLPTSKGPAKIQLANKEETDLASQFWDQDDWEMSLNPLNENGVHKVRFTSKSTREVIKTLEYPEESEAEAMIDFVLRDVLY